MFLECKFFFSCFIELKNVNLMRRIYFLLKLKFCWKLLKEIVVMIILFLIGYGKLKV